MMDKSTNLILNLVMLWIAVVVVITICLEVCEGLHRRDFIRQCVSNSDKLKPCLDAWEAEEWKRGLFQYEVNDEKDY